MGPEFTIILLFVFVAISAAGFAMLFNSLFIKDTRILTFKRLKTYYFIEYLGYTILIMALGWQFTSNMMNGMKLEAETYIINKKLDYLWEYLNNETELQEEYNELKQTEHQYSKWEEYNNKITEPQNRWYELQNSTKEITAQAKVTSLIQIILLLCSGILIAIGRLGDVQINLNRFKK